MGTYVVIQSNFGTYVNILKPHRSRFSHTLHLMCLWNKFHLKIIKSKLSVKYRYINTHSSVRTNGQATEFLYRAMLQAGPTKNETT